MMGGSEGCVYIELTTSGRAWGRGPVQSDIHGANKRAVDSPAWRHIKMLASLVSDDGNTPLIQGFADGAEPLAAPDTERLQAAAKKVDMKVAADIRYVPKMNGLEIVKKIRSQLDRNGYKDVEMKLIGDVPWSKMTYDTDLAHAVIKMYDEFGIPYAPLPQNETILGGYWPAYLFANAAVGQKLTPVSMPIAGGAAGHGGNAHAANEYYVIEGAGKVYGIAGAEKSIATVVYNFAGKNGPMPAPRTTH
jgi:hypothetical protein